MADSDDLINRFSYHAPKDDQTERYEEMRRVGLYFAGVVNTKTPPSREQSLALTAIEEAVMWANAAIARHE